MIKISKKEKWAIRNAQEAVLALRNRTSLTREEKDALAKLCNITDEYIENAEIVAE